jgi:hypothetical protein
VLAAPPAPGFEVARWDGQDRPVGHDHGEGILLFITSGHQIVLPPPGLAMLDRAAEELQTYQAGFPACVRSVAATSSLTIPVIAFVVRLQPPYRD